MGWVEMSERGLRRAEVLASVFAGRLTMTAAAQLLRVTRRQIFRLLKDFRQHGAVSLASKRRGKRGNHRLPASVCDLVMAIIEERYPDFGPTLANEKLRENHGGPVS